MTNEVIYTVEGNSDRGVVHSYHGKPFPRDLKGAGKKDIAGLPKRKQLAVVADGERARYSIGMEIEKNEFSRASVREYPLFCGFERDGSCGVEAVTNILPLLPASRWRMKVFNMMTEATRIIDDQYSKGDSSCGGHVNLSVEGMNGSELLQKMRPYAGIVLALYRARLRNSYCCHNPTLLDDSYENRDRHIYGYHYKYRVALPKGDVLEWRVVARFESVAQMMRRYELFYEVVDTSVNGDGSLGSFKRMLTRLRPVLMGMYGQNAEKVKVVCDLAERFRKYILTDGEYTDGISEWVRGR